MRRFLVLAAVLVMSWSGDGPRPLLAQTPPAQQPAPAPRPTRTEIVNHDNWSTTCQEFADGKPKICVAAIQIAAQNGQVIFIWSMSVRDGRIVASFQTPTGVVLAPGVELKTAKITKTIPFETCESGHCVATIPIDSALARDFIASQTVALSIHGSNGNTVKFDVPMKGIDKALAVLQK